MISQSSPAPQPLHTSAILYQGAWLAVTPAWVLARLRDGLRPIDAEIIALAAWPRPAEALYATAAESEAA
jgi:hypothetical protein